MSDGPKMKTLDGRLKKSWAAIQMRSRAKYRFSKGSERPGVKLTNRRPRFRNASTGAFLKTPNAPLKTRPTARRHLAHPIHTATKDWLPLP